MMKTVGLVWAGAVEKSGVGRNRAGGQNIAAAAYKIFSWTHLCLPYFVFYSVFVQNIFSAEHFVVSVVLQRLAPRLTSTPSK